jgi:SAM-dependent methyltransferase
MSAGWDKEKSVRGYHALIRDKDADSYFLRETCLKTPIMLMLADRTDLSFDHDTKILDVGSGGGWVNDHYQRLASAKGKCPKVFECDVSSAGVHQPLFSLQDVRSLAFAGSMFNAVIASLLLIYVEELEDACEELYRVTRPGGWLVVSIMHPMSYRMGEIEDDGSFRITRRYNPPWKTKELRIAGRAGPFTYYHRALFRYLNTLIETGWQLRWMHEWEMDRGAYELFVPVDNFDIPDRTDIVPMFAHFLMRKSE